jgi:hypothetical protein
MAGLANSKILLIISNIREEFKVLLLIISNISKKSLPKKYK